MERYRLRQGVTFCIAAGRPVFLDLPHDRYVLLPPDKERAFLKLLDGCEREQDWEGNPMFELLPSGVDNDRPLKPVEVVVAEADVCLSPQAWLSRYRAGSAILRRYSASRQIRRRPLQQILEAVRSRKYAGLAGIHHSVLDRLDIVQAFHAARLLHASRGQCLSESIALANALASVDCYPELVIGVSLQPFAAHCWIQSDGVVLNDRADHVRAYSPILVL